MSDVAHFRFGLKPVSLIHVLGWLLWREIRLETIFCSRDINLKDIQSAMDIRLGRQTKPSDMPLPVDIGNVDTINGFVFANRTKTPDIVIKFNEDGWYVTSCDLDDRGLEFFEPYSLTPRNTRIDLDMKDEFVDEFCDNIDDQYYVYKDINIYKDDMGYFTTCHQIDTKDINVIAEFLGFSKTDDSLIGVFNNIIRVLEFLGMTYNTKLVAFISEHLTKLIQSQLVNQVSLNYVADHRLLGGAKLDFVQLPFNPDYIVSCPAPDKTVIEFINIRTQYSCRVVSEIL